MAAEGAAPSGSRVAGMVGSLWLLALVSSVLALEGKRGGETEEAPPARPSTCGKWERCRKEQDIKRGKGTGKVPEKGSEETVELLLVN